MIGLREKYDVAVVGAGPAGAIAAYKLASWGLNVILIEKEKLPRYKTCGGGIIYRALKLIPFDISGYVESECYRAEVNDCKNNLKFVVERDNPIITMVMRNKFDNLIAEKAASCGAEIRDDSEVTEISESGQGISVKFGRDTITAGFLIAADGGRGIVSRKLKLKEDMNLVPGVEYEVDSTEPGIIWDKAIFEFGIIRHGYSWVFPKRKHLSIGILTMGNNQNLLKSGLDKFLTILEFNNNSIIEKHGYFIPIRKSRGMLAYGRILITGDAAGLADPTLVEGIGNAILSGALAAESIKINISNSRNVAEHYVSSVAEKIIIENKYSKILSQIVYNYPSLRSLLFKLNGKGLSEAVTDVAMDIGKYSRAVKNPINYFRLFKPLILHNR
jgi:geranylgeranyl reductase family protein